MTENEVFVPRWKIWAIGALCYGDEMAAGMTAIGCGGEESSSRANGFCYRRLAAGKLIKEWKRFFRGETDFFYSFFFLPAAAEEEKCGCLAERPRERRRKCPTEEGEPMPHRERAIPSSAVIFAVMTGALRH